MKGAALALVNIVRNGGGDTFDMDQHVHAHQNLRPQPEVPSPMSDINNTRGAAAAAGIHIMSDNICYVMSFLSLTDARTTPI